MRTYRTSDGIGGFATPEPFPVGAGPKSITWGDFNDDGVPDLVVTSRDGEVQAGPTRQGLGRGTWMVHPALCQE